MAQRQYREGYSQQDKIHLLLLYLMYWLGEYMYSQCISTTYQLYQQHKHIFNMWQKVGCKSNNNVARIITMSQHTIFVIKNYCNRSCLFIEKTISVTMQQTLFYCSVFIFAVQPFFFITAKVKNTCIYYYYCYLLFDLNCLCSPHYYIQHSKEKSIVLRQHRLDRKEWWSNHIPHYTQS